MHLRHPAVTPVAAVNGIHILELFHGPTLAFKDVALQFLGRVFEYYLAQSGRRLNILAATSGDTGSAALPASVGAGHTYLCALSAWADQPRPGTPDDHVPDDNVFCLAVRGSFDDCQASLKRYSGSAVPRPLRTGAVNSINWARLLAQIVYYFYGAFR